MDNQKKERKEWKRERGGERGAACCRLQREVPHEHGKDKVADVWEGKHHALAVQSDRREEEAGRHSVSRIRPAGKKEGNLGRGMRLG